ncbi:MAG: hypothetical protein JW829_16175 [Pirellulales bacterium]|nr:hypothetical protein [Pirellulales bacterium]
MELKNALAVCLISLFSATLVVLIARSLDSQAASRLEPKLAEIVGELRVLRGQGGIASALGTAAPSEAMRDGLVVYYFHGNTRCPTCRSIEAQAKETVQTRFASQLGEGKIIWKTANYEQDSIKPLAIQFEIQMPVVVLAKMKDGQVQDWKRLDEVWGIVGDKTAFTEYVQDEIEQMLTQSESSVLETARGHEPADTIPTTENEAIWDLPAIPLPQ